MSSKPSGGGLRLRAERTGGIALDKVCTAPVTKKGRYWWISRFCS